MSVAAAPPGYDLSLFIPDLKARKKEQAFAELVNAACDAGVVTDAPLLLEFLKLRERLGATAIGKGVAIPHARSATILTPRFLMARSQRGIDWGATDGVPVQLVFLVLSPGEWSDEAHHGWLARATSLARLQRTRQKLLGAASPSAAAAIAREVMS